MHIKISFLDGTIENYEDFLATNGKLLHPNHYHMLTAKHSLCQMLGRTEGCLIQDMSIEMVSILKELDNLFQTTYHKKMIRKWTMVSS